MLNQRSLAYVMASCTVLWGVSTASAQSNWTFGKIADTNTPYPTGAGFFESFNEEPSFSNGNVAFRAEGGDPVRQAVIKSSFNALSVVADTFTNVPGGGTFTSFGTVPPSISGLNPVVFTSFIPGGVFREPDIGTTPVVIADTTTPVPGTGGNFSQFDFFSPSVSGTNSIFRCGDSANSFQPGIYGEINGTLKTIAKFGANPGGPTLGGISGGTISGTNVGFYAVSNGRQGVYLHQGAITRLADTNNSIPGGFGSFTGFGVSPFRGPSTSGIHVAFLGDGSSGQLGVYHTIGGLVRAADKSTAIPGGSGNFLSFGPPSLGFDNLIFRGNGSSAQVGIYFIKASLGSAPQKVIARGDSLDGKVVDSVNVGRESIDDTGNQQFAFWVKFTDQSEGIFVATNLDCTITADDSVPADSTDNIATAPAGPGVYSWAVNGGTLDDGDGTNQITYTAGSGPDLTIDLTISFGTVSADCQKTVQVTTGPTATADNDGPVCEGSDIQLTGGPDGMTSYAWTGPNGFVSGVQNPTVSPAVGGIYTLTVTDADDMMDSADTTVVVNPNPAASADNNGPACADANVTLLGGPAGMTTYAWTGPNGFISNAQNPVVSPAVGGTYQLTVTDANGCQAVAETGVIVNDNPVATADNDGPVCGGTDVNLMGGPDGMASYAWTGPSGFVSAAQNPTVSPADSGTYTVTVTDANGCQASASTDVVVNATPATAANDGPVCSGMDVNLMGGPDGMASYGWTGPNGFASADQNPVVSPAVAGTYTLTITDDNGCQDSAMTVVSVDDVPLVTATNDGPVCNGVDINFTGGPDGLVSYAWTGPDGFTSNVQNPTVSPAVAGMYELTGTDANGCQASVGTNLVVNENPVATATNSGPACAGLDVALMGGPDGMAAYAWTGPGEFVSNEQNPVVSPAVEGTYDLTITDDNGCEGTAATDVLIDAVDTTDPVITCPDDVTVFCGASTDPTNTGMATATDNCDPDPVVTSADAGDPCPGVLTRTWTATDDAGNAITCDQIITLRTRPPSGGGGDPEPDPTSGSGVVDADGTFTDTASDGLGQTLGTVELTGAEPGDTVTFDVTDNDDAPGPNGGTFAGFADGVALGRTFTVETSAEQGTFIVTISVTFTLDELAAANVDATAVELHVLDTAQNPNAWIPAGNNIGESVPTGMVGDSGYFSESSSVTYWAVRDQLSTFAVGAAEGEPPPTDPDDMPPTDPVPDPPDDGDEPPAEPPPPADTDGDGVADDIDLCLDTAEGAEVGADGCAIEEMPAEQPVPDIPPGCGAAPCGVMGTVCWSALLFGLAQMRHHRRRRCGPGRRCVG